MNNFTLVNADTDSISFCKSDQTEITQEEQEILLAELNSLFPSTIRFEGDGYFKKVIVLRAKNYILWDGKKIKQKGSALKSSTLEPALKEFIEKIINSILYDRNDYLEIYNTYIKEINNIIDIRRWCSKKTISERTLESERTNELRIRNLLEGTEYSEGDKVYVFFKEDGNLELAERFKGEYNKDKLYEKLYKTMERFETVLDLTIFKNYKLKRNKEELNKVLLC